MSKHFNLRRFGRLFKKHTTENYKSYLMSLMVLVGGMSLVTGYAVYLKGSVLAPDQQRVFFMLYLLGAGTVFTSTVFANLGDKKRAIATLTLPASHIEKYLVAWLYSFLIYVVLFIPSFYLVMSIVLELNSLPDQEIKYFDLFSVDREVYNIFMLFAFLHALAIVGSIYFEKLPFIKTAFVFFSFLVLLVIINKKVLETLLQRELRIGLPFGNVIFWENKQFFNLMPPDNQQNLIGIMLVTLAFILWYTAYVRLKEKQV